MSEEFDVPTSTITSSVVVSCVTGRVYDVPDSNDLEAVQAQAEADDNESIAKTYEDFVQGQLPPLIAAQEEEVTDE